MHPLSQVAGRLLGQTNLADLLREKNSRGVVLKVETPQQPRYLVEVPAELAPDIDQIADGGWHPLSPQLHHSIFWSRLITIGLVEGATRLITDAKGYTVPEHIFRASREGFAINFPWVPDTFFVGGGRYDDASVVGYRQPNGAGWMGRMLDRLEDKRMRKPTYLPLG